MGSCAEIARTTDMEMDTIKPPASMRGNDGDPDGGNRVRRLAASEGQGGGPGDEYGTGTAPQRDRPGVQDMSVPRRTRVVQQQAP